MAKEQHKNTINTSQGNTVPPEPSHPAIATPTYAKTAETEEDDLKAIL